MRALIQRLEAALRQQLFSPSQPQLSLRSRERYIQIRRVAEVLLVIPCLLVLTPILIAILIAVRLDTPGPGLFRQQRPGRDGNLFNMYKFRSMTHSSQAERLGPRHSAQRITRVGNFLRRYKLDELPQLFNVLRGEMSLTGPRPEPRAIAEEWSQVLPHYTQRSVVPPGMSGAAQLLQGYTVNRAEEEQKLKYDLAYIRGVSWRMDLTILALTGLMTVGLHQAPAKSDSSSTLDSGA